MWLLMIPKFGRQRRDLEVGAEISEGFFMGVRVRSANAASWCHPLRCLDRANPGRRYLAVERGEGWRL